MSGASVRCSIGRPVPILAVVPCYVQKEYLVNDIGFVSVVNDIGIANSIDIVNGSDIVDGLRSKPRRIEQSGKVNLRSMATGRPHTSLAPDWFGRFSARVPMSLNQDAGKCSIKLIISPRVRSNLPSSPEA